MTNPTARMPDLRRAYLIARKPLAILAMLHRSDAHLADMGPDELREWIKGIELAL